MSDSKLIIKSKDLQGDDGYKVFSVRLKQSLLDQIDAVSQKSGRSRNEIFSLFIQYAYENCEVDGESAKNIKI